MCSFNTKEFKTFLQNPVITSINPAFGPEIGGTRVTIKGQLLGNDSNSINIMLGDDFQQVIERFVNT